MSETVVEWRLLGEQVKKMQDEMRDMKGAIDLLARTLPGLVQVMILDLNRATQEGQARIETRLDRIEARLDQTERSTEERLTRIEKLLQERQ